MSPLLSCSTLLLILLAICHGACSARPLGLGETAEILQDEDSFSSQISNLTNKKRKDGRKLFITDTQGTSRPQITSSETQNSSGSGDNIEVREMATRKHKRGTNHLSKKRSNHQRSKLLSEVGNTKVKYRVPQRKKGEKQPGFNLDYSPPKVHPPHHN